MFSSNTSQVAGASSDPQFNYVTMLLPGNGTNGAQNNTFVDSSTNNFSITRNGNTTQGTFTPYGANWSNYFDGSGDYLSLLSSTNLALGTGAFTIEAWVFNSSTEALFPFIGACSSPSGITQFGFANSANSVIRVVLGNLDYPSSGNSILLKGSGSVGVGQWAHVAYVRDSGVITIYLNGVSVGTVSDARDSVQQLRSVGASYSTYFAGLFFEWLGYISNLRFVKGTAVYASAFTPSASPLTAITNTQLLTCQSNRFIDNSSNNFTITRNGDVSVQRFSPFLPTAPYSAATVGGGGYFDGSGDTLSTSGGNVSGAGAFTVEFWIYPIATGSQQLIYGDANTGSLYIYFFGDNLLHVSNYNVANQFVSIPTTRNAWNHVVVVRDSSGNYSVFMNGARAGTLTGNTTNYASMSTVRVGGEASQRFIGGYMSDVRVSTNAALYNPTQTTITVPTAPLTAITNTNLLLNFTNAGIIDNAMMNDLETVGNAQISTAQAKFGTGSMSFNGTNSTLAIRNTPDLRLGSGNFTLEFFAYFNATSGNPYIMMCGNAGGTSGYYWYLNGANSRLEFYIGSPAITLQSPSAPSTSTWHHIAMVRNGSTLTMYLNGTSVASTTNSSWTDETATPMYIGSSLGSNYWLNGFIDDLRITKGVARYTANFTPPAAPFPTN